MWEYAEYMGMRLGQYMYVSKCRGDSATVVLQLCMCILFEWESRLSGLHVQ